MQTISRKGKGGKTGSDKMGRERRERLRRGATSGITPTTVELKYY